VSQIDKNTKMKEKSGLYIFSDWLIFDSDPGCTPYLNLSLCVIQFRPRVARCFFWVTKDIGKISLNSARVCLGVGGIKTLERF